MLKIQSAGVVNDEHLGPPVTKDRAIGTPVGRVPRSQSCWVGLRQMVCVLRPYNQVELSSIKTVQHC